MLEVIEVDTKKPPEWVKQYLFTLEAWKNSRTWRVAAATAVSETSRVLLRDMARRMYPNYRRKRRLLSVSMLYDTNGRRTIAFRRTPKPGEEYDTIEEYSPPPTSAVWKMLGKVLSDMSGYHASVFPDGWFILV